MSRSDVEALARRTVEALNAHDVDALRAMAGGSDEEWVPFERTMRAFYHAFPDYRIVVRKLVVGDDAFAIFCRVNATHLAEFKAGELEGIPASGKTLSWDEAMYSLVVEGKVVDAGLVVAGVERLQQLGVLPEPRRELPD